MGNYMNTPHNLVKMKIKPIKQVYIITLYHNNSVLQYQYTVLQQNNIIEHLGNQAYKNINKYGIIS